MVFFEFIDSYPEFLNITKKLASADVAGVDIECENNIYHYGVYLSLVQIAVKDNTYVVDAIALKNLEPLKAFFESEKVEKIFHDVSFDFRVIKKHFGIVPKNIFDTQTAAKLIGESEISLSDLMEKYLGITKNSTFQRSDWSTRPLDNEMIEYAAKDAHYLLHLREKLIELLALQKKLAEAKKAFSSLTQKDYILSAPDYRKIKGAGQLTNNELNNLRLLSIVRDKYAKIANRPAHFIIPNRMLIAFSKMPPASILEWQSLRGVHPIVKRNAPEFYRALKRINP
ncbi:MAG: ribonuclease D [archaeon]